MLKNIIKSWLVVPVMGIVWLFSLLYGTGIGYTYNIYNRTKLVVFILLFCNLIFKNKLKKFKANILILVVIITLYCFFTDIFYGNNIIDFVWMYLLVYLIGQLKIEESQMTLISLIYGLLGLAVLCVYNYGSIFSGWNENNIFMIAFFSIVVMLVSFNYNNIKWSLIFVVLYSIIYFKFSGVLNSRGGVLFTFIALLGAYNIIPFKKILKNSNKMLLILLIPLMIAIFISIIRNSEFAIYLDKWSIETFKKPIFNGRDELFHEGILTWLEHPLLGTGDLGSVNWHNSAITMLVGCGLIGFMIWVFVTHNILKKGANYLNDKIVYGLIVGFIAIWLQQSIELGLVAEQVNAIPYSMLGLFIGRINTINSTNKLAYLR